MKKEFLFELLTGSLRGAIQLFPDKRTGKNLIYTMEDAALGAFSVFFTQCPSFLAHQKSMEEAKGKSNAQTIFEMEKIPTDNHIRDLLDPVAPEIVYPVFDDAYQILSEGGHIKPFRVFNGDLLIALDATWYFASKKIHCDNCSSIKHKDGSITYYHSALTPVIVAPGRSEVIALAPEFILPQDGHDKQDCENAAAKRWIQSRGGKYSSMGATVLGDDLYCKQPICKELLDKGFNFILVCKPDTHKTLYEWVELLEEGVDRHTVTVTRWNGKMREVYTYRYANDVPLRDGDDAIRVNWVELAITTEEGEILYHNSFVTNHKITDKKVESIVLCGRARWKVENENNNTLKTKGYNLEHNYGHGEKNLSSLLATFIILAFLFHTVLGFMDGKYRLLREKLSARKTFFNDIRSLTKYICFDSWDHLMSFMIEGLELTLASG
jgi:hypothetical protein